MYNQRWEPKSCNENLSIVLRLKREVGIFITSRGVAITLVAFYCMATGLVPAVGTDFLQIYNLVEEKEL